jgi:aminomethyltransferase
MTPNSEAKMTKKQTGFHDSFGCHAQFCRTSNGCRVSCYAATGPIEEHHACREECVIMDSMLPRKFEITARSLRIVQYALPATHWRAASHRMCCEHGGMIDDARFFRLGKTIFVDRRVRL